MQKSNVKKIILLALGFLITVYVSLTYISSGSFDFISFNKSTVLLFSQGEQEYFDRDYIKTKQTITTSEPNGVGTVSHNYSLSFNELPERIISVSVDFVADKASVGSITLKTVYGEKSNSFEISNTSISDSSVVLQVGMQNIDEIRLVSQYDAYGGAAISNEEIVSISSVKINDLQDILSLRQQFLFALIKGLVVAAVIWLILFIVIKSKADQKILKNRFCIEKVFLVTALAVGFIFACIIPVYQVPDEQTHINIIYDELNWDINIKTQSDISDFADTLRIIRNYDQKVNLSTYFNMQTKAPLPDEFSLPSIKIVRHLPQAIPFVLTSLMRLPLWMCVAFAEFFAAAVYALLGYLTIKIMPFKKELMTAIMLLPICLQEFPSLSYDSFLLSSYFLLFAYILYVKFTKDKFTLVDITIIIFLFAVIAITKIPYALVVALVLLIPISKIDLNFGLFRLKGEFIQRHKVIFSMLTGLCMIFAIIVGIKLLPHISEGRTFIAAVYDVKASFGLTFETAKFYLGEWLTQMTGSLGWFDTPVALVFTVFVVANLLFLNLFDFNNKLKKPSAKNPFKAAEIGVIVITGFGMLFITILSMFGWTMQAYGLETSTLTISQMSDYMGKIPRIGGLQGRYFLPVLPLLLVPTYFPKVSAKLQTINHTTYLCVYHLTVYIYIVVVLVSRYWI